MMAYDRSTKEPPLAQHQTSQGFPSTEKLHLEHLASN